MESSVWSDIKEDLLFSKQRPTGLESLETLLARTNLGKAEVGELVSLSRALLSDSNSKVAQQALETLASVALRADASVTTYASQLVPCVAECLSNGRQQVRAQAFQVLVSYFSVLKPEVVLEKLAPLWQHKNWKVKLGLLEVIAEAVSKTGASVLGARDQNNAALKQIVRMMEEPEGVVREAAVSCLSEIYRQVPAAVVSTINASNLPPKLQREVLERVSEQPTTLDTAALDASKHSNGGLNMYEPDTGLASHGSGGGYYVMPDMTAPITSGSGRVSANGSAVQSAAAVDAGTSAKPDSRRQSGATAGPSQLPAAPSANVKRGGFKDGGGIFKDGELPIMAPIPITSERELRAEMEAAVAELAKAPNTEWQERMDAMQRVEGLVLGGAADWECFHEAMKGLTQALSQQFKERRSTIARQACHLIGVLARALGPRFEPYAVTLVSTLFGVLVITIAIMAESADDGVRSILRHCQTGRLLQAISDSVCKEKNPKTRQFCAGYLVQILEQWDVGIWGRYLEAVEVAIRSAAQDTSAETRQSGRTAMALYNSALPDRAQAFLKRLDSGLQDKLSAGMGAKPAKLASTGLSRQSVSAALAASRRAARQVASVEAPAADSGILVMVPTTAKAERCLMESQPASSAAIAEPAAPRLRTAVRAPAPASSQAPAALASCSEAVSTAAQGDAAARPLTATLGRPSRKSLGLPPGRIPGGSADLTAYLGDNSLNSSVCDPATQARIAALRKPRLSAVPFEQPLRTPKPSGSHAVRVAVEPSATARLHTPETPASRPPFAPGAATAQTRLAGTVQPQDGSSHAAADSSAAGQPAGSGLVPLSRVVTTVLGGPRSWSDKVEALTALDAHVRASVSGALTSPIRSGSDPGASASVSASQLLLVAEPEKVFAALERVRERIMEALDDPHQKVLAAALTLLADVVRLYGRVMEGQLDRLLPVLLSKGAENKEQSRALCAEVLNECGQVYRADVLMPALTKCLDVVKLARGKQTVLEFFRGHIDRWGAINPTQLKLWMVRLAPVLDDKAPELRKRAADVLDALLAAPWAREPINYVAYQHNSPDVGPLRRYLASQGAVSNSAAASETGLGSTLTHHNQTPTMSVAGIPPATTHDSRRQLPSASPAVPVLKSTPLQPPIASVAAPTSGAQYRGPASGPGLASAQDQSGPSGPTTAPSSSRSYATQPSGTGFRNNAMSVPSTSSSGGGGYGPGNGLGGSRDGGYGGSLSAAGPPRDDGAVAGPRARGQPVPRDPGTQLTLLPKLLDAARGAVGGYGGPSATPETLAAVMEGLAEAAEQCGREVWVRVFPSLMVEINTWVQHTARPVRAMAFVLLKQLLQHQPSLFTDNSLESQVNLLLNGCVDDTREVSVTAGNALRLLLSGCNGRYGMLLLQQLLPRERELHRRSQDKGVRLVAMMDGVRQLAVRLDQHELQRLTFAPHPDTGATLLEALVSNLSDTETSVRRAAVVALADLWCRVGPGVRDVLQVLASSSYNLLCIYYLKQRGVMVVAGQGNPTEHPMVTDNDDNL